MYSNTRKIIFKYSWYLCVLLVALAILSQELLFFSSSVFLAFVIVFSKPVADYFCNEEIIIFPHGVSKINEKAHWLVLIHIIILALVFFTFINRALV